MRSLTIGGTGKTPLPRLLGLACALAAAVISISCGSKDAVAPLTELPSGLQYRDRLLGGGAMADSGYTVTIDYTIWLSDGTRIDSSHDRGAPIRFLLGAGQVIAGFDQGIQGMR